MNVDTGALIITALSFGGFVVCVICLWIRAVVRKSKRLALSQKEHMMKQRAHRAALARAEAETAHLKAVKAELPDGTVYLYDGTKILPDGTQILPDGTVLKPDGTERRRKHHSRPPRVGRSAAAAWAGKAKMPSFMNWEAVFDRQKRQAMPGNPVASGSTVPGRGAPVGVGAQSGKGNVVMPARQQAWM